MANMTIQTIVEAGVAPSYGAVNDGDTFDNQGDVALHVKNGGGGPITVTITPVAGANRPISGLGQMTKAVAGGSVSNGAEKIFGPFPPGAFNNSAGRVTVNYSGVTTVTAAALRLAQP